MEGLHRHVAWGLAPHLLAVGLRLRGGELCLEPPDGKGLDAAAKDLAGDLSHQQEAGGVPPVRPHHLAGQDTLHPAHNLGGRLELDDVPSRDGLIPCYHPVKPRAHLAVVPPGRRLGLRPIDALELQGSVELPVAPRDPLFELLLRVPVWKGEGGQGSDNGRWWGTRGRERGLGRPQFLRHSSR